MGRRCVDMNQGRPAIGMECGRWLSAAPSILLIVPWPRKRKVDDASAVQAGKAIELLYASSGLLSNHAHSADRTSSRIGPALLLHGAGSRATEPQAWAQ